VTYLVFLAALVLAAIGVALTPETREAAKPRPRYRPQRLSVPPDERSRFFAAALSTFVAFAAMVYSPGSPGCSWRSRFTIRLSRSRALSCAPCSERELPRNS
jgi:hypothetical protein